MRPHANALAALALALFALAAAAGLNYAFWRYEGRPQQLPDAHAARIKSASFSPYRRGQSPFGTGFSAQEMAEDMAVAAGRFERIRTYACTGRLAEVPELARKHGLKVILGAWLGASLADNEEEIAGVIRAANAYPDVVERVVVGNEVLLREEITEELLLKYIARVKAAVRQPVTYADVWEYWLEHPRVAAAVDSITIHVLPYWENTPTPLDRTVAHMLEAHDSIARAYPGKPVLIGEIGWPSAGRMREGAAPGRVAQARFVRQIINAAAEHGIDYNFFELFDEPWKARQEGAVGAHWGLMDADRQMKFPLAGPVSEKPWWLAGFFGTSLAGALLAGLALWLRPPRGLGNTALVCLAAQALATLLALSAEQSLGLAFDLSGAASGVFMTGVGALLCLLVFSELADRATGLPDAGPRPLAPVIARLEALRSRRVNLKSRAELVGLLDLFFGLAILAQTVGLVVDPRYRDFRTPQLLPVALCLLVRLLATRTPPRPVGSPREEWLLAGAFVAGAVAIPLLEKLSNTEALCWSGALLLLACSWGLTILRLRRAAAG